MVKRLIYKYRLKRAIKKANELAELTEQRFLVLLIKGRPVVKSKGNLKQLVKEGKFKIGISELENIAVYKTYKSVNDIIKP